MAITNIPTNGLWSVVAGYLNSNFAYLLSLFSDNIVYVRSEDDLPIVTNVGGIDIHRLLNKKYIIDGNVSITNPIGWPGAGNTATITAINRSTLTYTGVNALFYDSAAEGNIEVVGLTEFKAPTVEMWNVTAGTAGFSFQTSGEADRFTDCESLGVINGNGNSSFNIGVGSLSNFNQGLVVNNTNFFEINSCFVFGSNAVGCTYFTVQGALTTGSVNFDTVTVGNGTNETLFNINPNIQAGIDAVNIRLSSQEGGINGDIFAAGSLTEKDTKVLSVGNSIIGNTIPGGLLSMTANASTTLAPTTPKKVVGTWIVREESQFTGSTTGRLTYNDVRSISVDLDAIVSLEPAVGNGIVVRAYIAKNGVAIVGSGKSTTIDKGKPQIIPISWRDDISKNDYFEIFVKNETNSSNITAIDATLRIP